MGLGILDTLPTNPDFESAKTSTLQISDAGGECVVIASQIPTAVANARLVLAHKVPKAGIGTCVQHLCLCWSVGTPRCASRVNLKLDRASG